VNGRTGWRYLVRRLLLAVLVMWAAFTITFIILYLVPGDPAQLIAGGEGGTPATPDQIAAVNQEYGFDRPVLVQYFHALGGAVHGDLGNSYQMKQPVRELIAQEFGSTFTLAMFALLAAIVLGALIGSITVYTRSKALTKLLDAVPSVGASLPTFWVGLMLMQAFSFGLHVFPSAGDSGFSSLVLPGLTIAIPSAAVIAQVLARSLRNSFAEPYVEIARAKGASRLRVFAAHAARNSLLPTVTVAGMAVANLFAYSTVVETIFSRNGLGLALERAVQSKDVPVVEGVVLVVAAIYVLANLVVDLVYPIIDPRLRAGSASALRKIRKAVAA
jgi:peptide/nickel transport system permease protein